MAKIRPTVDYPTFAAGGFHQAQKTDTFSVETTTFTLPGDNETYFATYWNPQEELKGLVFICHGYGEYFCPSYDGIAQALAENGFKVFGHDHVGHGRSTGQRVQVESLENDYMRPVLSHCKKVQNDHKNVPLFIIGHSMGGLITTYCVLAEPELFKGVVLMGPLIKMDPNIATPLKKTLARLVKGILPSFTLGEIEASAITRDASVVQRVKDDPLAWHGGFRAQHSHVLLQATDAFLSNVTMLKKFVSPLLIFQGGKDRLVCPDGAPYLLDNVGSADKKLLTYPDAFHNLYVELDDIKNAVTKETCDWIIKHC